MIVPDINLLIYAHNEAAGLHAPARAWWEDLMTREQAIGLPWAVVLGFVRLVTHPAVLADPLLPDAALARVRRWVERSHVRFLEPGPRHLDILDELFAVTGVGGSLTTDTHLAALAIEYKAELHSNDADFACTRTILQSGQVAETASRSRACSWAQPTLTRGRLVPPFWSMIRRHPLAVVQADRPKVDR